MNHPLVSRDRWLVARKALLVREKALTRLADQIAHEREEHLSFTIEWVRHHDRYEPEPSACTGTTGRRCGAH